MLTIKEESEPTSEEDKLEDGNNNDEHIGGKVEEEHDNSRKTDEQTDFVEIQIIKNDD